MYASVKTLAAVLLLSSVASAHILGMGYVYWRYLFGMDKREPESMAVPKEILQARHTIEAGVLKDLGSRSEPGPDHVSGSRAVFGF